MKLLVYVENKNLQSIYRFEKFNLKRYTPLVGIRYKLL